MSLIERSFQEKIVIVGVMSRDQSVDELNVDLLELKELVRTAGAKVVDTIIQKRDVVDPNTYIGSGKAIELKEICYTLDVDTVVFDNDLSPVQQRNLELILGRTAIDRTAVILDIFAQNAKSEQGKMQVELALLNYRLPRLRGRGISLSQQGGGIGTRGPGETQLESDRRQLLATKTRLEKRLRKLTIVADTQRRLRNRTDQFRVSLVGYTNAGKSTLLNSLVESDEYVADQLFATLDTKIKKLKIRDNSSILISDTVGFIRKLPHHLVEAFKSTLSEIEDSDLLVHVVDGTSEDPVRQIEAVETVLNDLKLSDIPQLVAVNKSDKDRELCRALAEKFNFAVFVSAKDGFNLDRLREMIYEAYLNSMDYTVVAIPEFRQDLITKLQYRTYFNFRFDSSQEDEPLLELTNNIASLTNFINVSGGVNFKITDEFQQELYDSVLLNNYTFPVVLALTKINTEEIRMLKKYILKTIKNELQI